MRPDAIPALRPDATNSLRVIIVSPRYRGTAIGDLLPISSACELSRRLHICHFRPAAVHRMNQAVFVPGPIGAKPGAMPPCAIDKRLSDCGICSNPNVTYRQNSHPRLERRVECRPPGSARGRLLRKVPYVPAQQAAGLDAFTCSQCIDDVPMHSLNFREIFSALTEQRGHSTLEYQGIPHSQ